MYINPKAKLKIATIVNRRIMALDIVLFYKFTGVHFSKGGMY
jgi:hypothetical protein